MFTKETIREILTGKIPILHKGQISIIPIAQGSNPQPASNQHQGNSQRPGNSSQVHVSNPQQDSSHRITGNNLTDRIKTEIREIKTSIAHSNRCNGVDQVGEAGIWEEPEGEEDKFIAKQGYRY